MLVELVRQLTKIKKKHGDIPVLYVYDNLGEMAIVNLIEAQLVYTNIRIREESISISASEYKEGNFIGAKYYDAEKHVDFKPVIIITEKL